MTVTVSTSKFKWRLKKCVLFQVVCVDESDGIDGTMILIGPYITIYKIAYCTHKLQSYILYIVRTHHTYACVRHYQFTVTTTTAIGLLYTCINWHCFPQTGSIGCIINGIKHKAYDRTHFKWRATCCRNAFLCITTWTRISPCQTKRINRQKQTPFCLKTNSLGFTAATGACNHYYNEWMPL